MSEGTVESLLIKEMNKCQFDRYYSRNDISSDYAPMVQLKILTIFLRPICALHKIITVMHTNF